MPSNILFVRSLDSGKEFQYKIYSESFDVFLKFFTEAFKLGELLVCSLKLANDGEVLDLGDILYEANCSGSCVVCNDDEKNFCHRMTAINFLSEVNKRLEVVIEKKFWNDFLSGKTTYRVC